MRSFSVMSLNLFNKFRKRVMMPMLMKSMMTPRKLKMTKIILGKGFVKYTTPMSHNASRGTPNRKMDFPAHKTASS